ncbi:gamma-secretase subunit Aph-1 like protein [Danaus plexippus plexippus]|uniref:Gamma-secretase subunit Aph-1 like protein n=1 Tax=Danaus plexippus plexippus TaxID=278856 RepID=A0A212EX56_DANPL|nr:gamma-secretase subunit Aph-1 like protein [Danaus plexippus plexippus]
MTAAEFFSCSLLAFGAPLAMFALTIANDPVRIIIMIAAAFFWLLSFLLSSMLWYAVVPLRSYLAFGMVFAILIQETFRFGVYLLLKRTESGLKEISENHEIGSNKAEIAYVSGFGFGAMSGAFAIINVLADSIGPGTLGLRHGTEYFFVTSASMTLCMTLLNTFWTVIFFNGLDNKSYLKILWVIGSHFLVSGLSLLNRKELYVATIIPSYIILVITLYISFKCAGGSSKGFLQTFRART